MFIEFTPNRKNNKFDVLCKGFKDNEKMQKCVENKRRAEIIKKAHIMVNEGLMTVKDFEGVFKFKP